MDIQIYDRGESIKYHSDTLYLRRDHWDDYSFRTTFNVSYCKSIGDVVSIGQVKIGVQGLDLKKIEMSGSIITEPAIMFDIMPKQFSKLDDIYFSLG